MNNKSILIIDTPSCCSRCTIFNDNQLLCCGSKVNYKESQVMRSSICPLKPLPERKCVESLEEELSADDFMKTDIQKTIDGMMAEITLNTNLIFAVGYNHCLDEIIGDEE